jgi:hypothetical protein
MEISRLRAELARVRMERDIPGKSYGVLCQGADSKVDMPRVLLCFDRYTLDDLRGFVVRCNPENMPEFEHSILSFRGVGH